MRKITYKMFSGFDDPRNDYGYSDEYYRYWIILGYISTLVIMTGLAFVVITALMSCIVR